MLKKHFWITNFVFFQAIWFACAFVQGLAIPIASILLISHAFVTPTLKNDIYIAIFALIVGSLLDVALIHLDFIAFKNQASHVPIWLALLWCYFGTTYNHALGWLKQLPFYFVFVFGAVLGPSSYFAAGQIGVFEYKSHDLPLLLIHILSWGVLNLVFVKLSIFIDEFLPQKATH